MNGITMRLLAVGILAQALNGAEPMPSFVEPQPGEHPRLFIRKHQLAEFRKRAHTPEGRVITANLRELLKKEVPLEQVQSGETRLAGLWAAGRGTLYAITGEKADADAARAMVAKLVDMPVIAMPELRRGTRYMGIAMAYDLCYDAWPEDFRTKVAAYLEARADGLLTRKEGVQGDNPATQSNHNVEGRTQMGVIALAITGDPGTTPAVEKIIDAARRDLHGWSTTALGDHGWGTEGEGFTINCLNWGVFQFAAAHQNMYNKPATDAAGLQWVLPLIMARVVGGDMPYHGPQVSRWDGSPGNFGSSFYVLGLGTVPPATRPAVKAFYDMHFGLNSKAPFRMENPAEALFLLAYYPFDLEPRPLADALPKAIEDKRKGYYVFRNAYRDSDDCLTVAYLHTEPLRASWRAAPGVQVRGLGRHWLAFDPTHSDDPKFAAPGAKATHFAAQADGSGTLSAKSEKGAFSLAVDYSGAAGVPALLALSDRSNVSLLLETSGKATINGRTFHLAGEGGATLQGTLVAPEDGQPASHAKGVTLPAGAFVVMTLQKGEAPKLATEGRGMGAVVTVGKQTIRVSDGNVVLAKQRSP